MRPTVAWPWIFTAGRGRRAALLQRASRRHRPAVRRLRAVAALPAVLAAVLCGLLSTPGNAAVRAGLRQQIEHAARTPYVILQLFDGEQVIGSVESLVGNWSDPTDPDLRYEAWRSTRAEGIPKVGEPVRVVLVSGDTLQGAFRGVTSAVLALSGERPQVARAVEFGSISALLLQGQPAVLPWVELRDTLLTAPSLTGVALNQGTRIVIVPREAILSARGDPSVHDANPALIVAGIAGVVALAVICSQEAQHTRDDILGSCAKSITSKIDTRFAGGTVSHGVGTWPAGETRRP